MTHRWIFALLVAGAALGTACDDDDGDGGTPLGDYQVFVFENRDTCDGVFNDFETSLEVTRTDGTLRVAFGGFDPLPATLDSQGALSAQGAVVETADGRTTTLRLEDVVFFVGGSVEGEGELVLDGTFPDPDAPDPDAPRPCVQEFTFTGQKVGTSRVPALPTAPRSR